MIKKIFAFCFLISATSTISASTNHQPDLSDPLSRDTFTFRSPAANDLGPKVSLWATYYYLPQMNNGSGDIAIRDMNGADLGASLSLKDWCNAALEGSVRIVSKNADPKTFNYAGVSSSNTVNCKKIFKPDVSKTKFKEAVGPYGDGYKGYILEPFRSIATDQSVYPLGTVFYIPAARGAVIKLPTGQSIVHDGYFFASDKGGAIKVNHIDVFIGTDSDVPYFPWVKSSSSGTFEAYTVVDKTIIAELNELHLPK